MRTTATGGLLRKIPKAQPPPSSSLAERVMTPKEFIHGFKVWDPPRMVGDRAGLIVIAALTKLHLWALKMMGTTG